MPRSIKSHGGTRRQRWTRKTLFCSALLPLFVSPLNALRIPSRTASSFIGPCGIRGSSTRLCAVQVEEETLQSHPDEYETVSQAQETPLHYAFETVASVKIVGVQEALHSTIPDRNGQSSNGHAASNGFPLHAKAYEVNGEKVNGHTQPVDRVVNGVMMPPYSNGSTLSPVYNEPPKPNGAAAPQPELNGSTQPSEVDDGESSLDVDESDVPPPLESQEEEKSRPTIRKLWQRRHARSIEEGLRSEKAREKTTQLSRILGRVPAVRPPKRGYFARTISGLINALAEEADGLEVNVKTQEETPIWRKKVDAIRIDFARLGFKPLRMGGLDEAIRSLETQISESRVDQLAKDLELAAVSSVDEAFDRIDEDNSGALDAEEIAKALNLAASSDSDEILLEGLASQLVELYDFNGDGLVDREEYQSLVADMATLRQAEKERVRRDEKEKSGVRGAFGKVSRWIRRERPTEEDAVVEVDEVDEDGAVIEDKFVDITEDVDPPLDVALLKAEKYDSSVDVVNISDDAAVDSVAKSGGSIVLEDMKLDLRQLLFGMLPIVKSITPGGPLILEPFTATVTGSFNREDIKASMLLDMGLRRLVARALRRRVRSFRDLMDGAVFYGRRWTMASKSAPMVEVPELTSVEFDKENRMILTGRAQVRTSPDAPFIENSFKVRTKIGTRRDGHVIRLVEPELAFVLECPKSFEKAIRLFFGSTGLPIPPRPKPLYSFFPIYSPFQVDDNDGFDMGEDNRIKSMEIRDGSLQFELSAVLRPGRFLGSHYLAFTLPMRTFIITMARVREGIRTARRNKRAAQAKAKLLKSSERKDKGRSYLDVVAQSLSSQELVADREKFRFADTRQDKKLVIVPAQPIKVSKSFFSRFVDGYLGARKEARKEASGHHESLTIAISDWFGRQGSNKTEDNQVAPTRRRQEV